MSTDRPSVPNPSGDPRDAFAELGRLLRGHLAARAAPAGGRPVHAGGPGVAEASVSVIADDKPTTPGFTGQLAIDLDESQYDRGYGPCLEAAIGQEIREITDARAETRWPEYTPVCVERGSLTSLSVPVPVPVRDNVHAALNLYGHQAHAFESTAHATGREFAGYVAVAVRNLHLYETTREWDTHLDAAMQSRAVIEQAKGI